MASTSSVSQGGTTRSSSTITQGRDAISFDLSRYEVPSAKIDPLALIRGRRLVEVLGRLPTIYSDVIRAWLTDHGLTGLDLVAAIKSADRDSILRMLLASHFEPREITHVANVLKTSYFTGQMHQYLH